MSLITAQRNLTHYDLGLVAVTVIANVYLYDQTTYILSHVGSPISISLIANRMSTTMHSPILHLFLFAALATAQNLGDPALLKSYPTCAAQCQIEVISLGSNPCGFTSTNNLTCQCDGPNRAATAACEAVSCSPTEYGTTQTLAQQLCGPLYANGTLSASPVSAAVTAATSAALSAVAGKDPTSTNDYPTCATACQRQYVPSSGCGSLANRTCVCNDGPLNKALGGCETSTCSPEDRLRITYLAYQLCRSVGGLNNASEIANATVATQTQGSVVMPAPNGTGSVVPFTGEARGKLLQGVGWALLWTGFVLGATYVAL
ncbi:MAG: hypothetical protein Q9220_006723 [cf. Caloplaca sp. 1 TL-2023]